MNRNTTFFVENLKEIKFCGKTIIQEIEGTSYEIPFEIMPTKGEVHDFETCENCQENLAQITEVIQQRFEVFPNCCTQHKNLINYPIFKKSDFNQVVKITANKHIYTKNHIINNIDSKNWYKEITDYIEYVIASFGSMPKDCGEPFCLNNFISFIKSVIENKNFSTIQKEQRVQLLEFIDNIHKTEKQKKVSFDKLISIYERWLSLFPFNINYFKDFKEYFIHHIPLFKVTNYNPYLDTSSIKVYSQSELAEILFQNTKELLSKIDTIDLVQKSKIDDKNKHHLELINSKHKIKQKKLLGDFLTTEMRYIKLLEHWLKNETDYFKEITPIIDNLTKSNLLKENEKDFPSFFLHNESFKIAQLIKEEFKTEKGKVIKILIDILKEFKLISLDSRGLKKFYDCMRDYFDNDIGSYESIRKQESKHIYTPDIEAVRIRIKNILSKLDVSN